MREGLVQHITVNTIGSPLWLTIVTLCISIGAVTISLWQAILSSIDRRTSRPRVSIRCAFIGKYHGKPGEGTKAVLISVKNLGREATSISLILVYTPSTVLQAANNLITGEAIPFKLEGYSSTFWAVNAEAITERLVTTRLSFGHGLTLEQDCELNRPPSKPRRTSEVLEMPPKPKKGLLRRRSQE